MAYDYALSPDKYLSTEEEHSLRATLAKYRDSELRNTTMILLMLVCGLRAQETVNLIRADFNFDDNTLFVKTIKNGRPRIVPLPTDLSFRFKELFIKTKDDRPFPIKQDTLLHIWEQYRPVKKGSHSLRHTAAKNIYMKTKDISLAQAFLGHKSISTTAVYLQIQGNIENMRAAIS